MKKIYGTLIALSMSLFSGAIFSATLDISATVTSVCEISLDVATYSISEDIRTTNVTDKPVATATEDCNDPAGYTVTVSSANNWHLANVATTKTAAYSVKYGGILVSNTNSFFLPLVLPMNTSGSNSTSKTLTVTIPADSTLDSGTYTDTLTLAIAAK